MNNKRRHAASHHNRGHATGNIFQTMREIVLDTEPSSGRALGPIQISRAPFRASPLLRGKTRPQGASLQTLPKDRPASRSLTPSEQNVLETHPFTGDLSSPTRASLIPNDWAYRASPGRVINPVASTDSSALLRCKRA
jgi:hypothetical protein